MHANKLVIALLALALLVACGGDEETTENAGGQAGGNGSEVRATPPAGEGAAEWMAAYDRGLDALKKQAEGGSFGNPGFTALGVTGFLVRPGGVRPEDEEFVDSCLESIASHQKENGGIYEEGVANYTTCVAIMALAESGEYPEEVKRAAEFVKSLQLPSGGIGYSDNHPGEPDLSNTQFAVEALRKAGVPQDDPVFSKALQFLQSVQNDSESNDSDYRLEDGRMVVIQDDGGAFYGPGSSKAGVEELEDGKVALRSYGSMTYALLKCYLLAGLPKDDPRVQAAVKWARNNYTLEENPGFEDDPKNPNASMQGYYYYLMMMGKALDLLGVGEVKDKDGIAHDWREEIRSELLDRQNEDGTWVNEKAERWYEGNPIIAGSYALITLSHCAE